MTRYQNASAALPLLLEELLNSPRQGSRNGGMRESLMNQITLLNPDSMGITTPGRNASLPAQIAETMWLLAGRDDIEWLSYYLPRAAEFSDDGKTWRGAYGPRIRKWPLDEYDPRGDGQLDQLAHVVKLIKQDVNTRRAVISIYNPDIDATDGKDIPCNDFLQFIVRDGHVHGHVFIRSNDLMWGWSGINAFEWTALLNVVASLTGHKRGSLTFSITSLHLYERHYDKAQRILDQFNHGDRPSYVPDPVPRVHSIEELDELLKMWFTVESDIRAGDPSVKNRISTFPDPMFGAWLAVLWAWHQSNPADTLPMYLMDTSLFPALLDSPARKTAPEGWLKTTEDFGAYAGQLHAEKNKAYGDSWKKRGEMLGIMANLARKVDRLGVSGGGDTSADTALDLLVYLLKYELWLETDHGDLAESEIDYTTGGPHVQAIFEMLADLVGKWLPDSDEDLIQQIREGFDKLEALVTEKRGDRRSQVQNLIVLAYPLAVRLWADEESAKEPVGDVLPLKFGDSTPLPHAQRNATRSWNPES